MTKISKSTLKQLIIFCTPTFPKLREVPKLFQNYEKCPNFSKITKYALKILRKLQKWPNWIQTSQNSPKDLKNPKFHLF